MAWNDNPDVRALSNFADKQKFSSVIALCMMGDGKFSVVSYGKTVNLCKKAKQVNSELYNFVMDGTLKIPDELIA